MAFQLRRGTNENRQFITPAEGELLYTTDTNRLYVGGKTDGEGALVTGGIAVGSGVGGGAVDSVNGQDGDVVLTLDDIDGVVITGTPSDGQVLKYDTGTSKWVNSTGSGTINTGAEGSFAFYAADGDTISGGAGIDLVDGILVSSLPITTPGYFKALSNVESKQVWLHTASDGLECGEISLTKSRGTVDLPEQVGVYEPLGRIFWEGWTNATDLGIAASIEAAAASYVFNTDPISINYIDGDGATITIGFTDAPISPTPFVAGASVTISGVVSETGNYNGTYIVGGVDGNGMVVAGSATGVYTSGGTVANDINIVPGELNFTTTNLVGERLSRLKINNDGVVFVGPTAVPENPGYTGRLVVVSLENSSASIDEAAISIRSCFDGTGGQRLVTTRGRGTLDATTQVLAGDDLFSINIHGNSTTVTDILSSRIVGMAEGTIGASIVPGKLILQTANSAGSLVDGLTVNSKQMTTFGGMAKIVSYADEAAAETAVGGTPSNGMMYYDSGANVAKMYGDSAWHALW